MSTKEFPRVEEQLFPELKGRRPDPAAEGAAAAAAASPRPHRPLYLLSVGWDENFVQQQCARAVDIFERNVARPRKYLRLYDDYGHLLNGDADRDRDRFLSGRASLSDFQAKMRGYSRLKRDILAVRNKALLNLFVLDCTELNKGMAEHCQQLYDSLIKHQACSNS